MVRASNGDDQPCNSGNSLQYRMAPETARCVADRCAMWRWEPRTASVPTTTLGAGGEPARTFKNRTVRTHGYCGLAPLHQTN